MAIEQPDLSHRHAFSKLPQHIGIAYLYDLENVSKDSLLNDLIVSKNATYLLDLVYFFWHLRDKLNEKTREKIKPLWAAIINSCTQAGEINYKEVLASLSYWLSLIDTIDDDVVAWMQISNKYLSDRSPLFYLEYLNRHVKNP